MTQKSYQNNKKFNYTRSWDVLYSCTEARTLRKSRRNQTKQTRNSINNLMDHVSIRTLKIGGYVLTKKLKNLFQRPNVIANITNGSLILKSPNVTDRLEKVVQFRQLLRKIQLRKDRLVDHGYDGKTASKKRKNSVSEYTSVRSYRKMVENLSGKLVIKEYHEY